MKRFFVTIIGVTLSLSFFCSCSRVNGIQKGITVSDKKIEYSVETHETANQILYDLIVNTYGKFYAVNQTTKPKVEGFCKDLESTLSTQNLAEEDFSGYFNFLKENTDKFSENADDYKDGKISLYECFSELIDETVSCFGIKTMSNAVKQVIVLSYDKKIIDVKNKIIASKNQTLINYYKEEETALTLEKKTFEGISEESFKNLVKSIVMFYKIYSANEEKGAIFGNFSYGELTAFGKNLSFDVELSLNEWKVVFKLFKALSSDSKDFFDAIEANNKERDFASFMNDLFLLLRQTQKSLTEEDFVNLDNGSVESFLSHVFGNLNSERWKTIERLANLRLTEKAFTDIIENSEFFEKVINAELKTYEDLKNTNEGKYIETLLGVAHGVFYD